ncbi:MAG: M56 family metallopeptidase, partial [Thermoanaerobaculia bacterium]|nr:M56 family metallopeptidase [Thermoanaerobaculia bacterium]
MSEHLSAWIPVATQVLLAQVVLGSLLVAALAAALRWVPRLDAATRHTLWITALVCLLLLPFAPLAAALLGPRPASGPAATIPGDTTGNAQAIVAAAAPPAASGSAPARFQGAPGAPGPITRWRQTAEPLLAVWLAAWVGLAAWRLLRLGLGYLEARRLHRRGEDAPDLQRQVDELVGRHRLRRRPEVRLVDGIAGPISMGLARPWIGWPAGRARGCEAATRHALLHELAHVARHDTLAVLVQRLAEALLVLSPAVWYVSRRLELERESASDDW